MQPTVICSNQSLTELPLFDVKDDPFDRYPTGGSFYSQKFFFLDTNLITKVPKNAFTGLGRLYSGANLTFDLSYNQISLVDDNAFEGLENNTVNLKFRDNRLTSLPRALADIPHLGSLDLSLNPLKTIDKTIMTNIGMSLRQIFISLDNFEEMPGSMDQLQAQVIGLDGLQETQMGAALQADDYTGELKELFISNSSLKDLSAIPCRFPSLFHLELKESYHLNANPFERCNTVENTSLNQLHIEQCNLTTINVSLYTGVTYLSFRDNLLETVPSSIRKLTELWFFDVSHNRITSITDDDFKGLATLADVVLDYNPLETITDSAFVTNDIRYLSLRHTNLATVPPAILNTPNLHSLTLPENTIECTCTNLHHLIGWRLNVYRSYCHNDAGTSISDYIENELPKCQ